VVTSASLRQFPPTPLLDAVVLGTAARHHRAIASWRDFSHVQKVIAHELRRLFGTRQGYQPRIQTVQALLLTLMKIELATEGHRDIMSIPLRLGLLCKMAMDLGINKRKSCDSIDDQSLEEVLW